MPSTRAAAISTRPSAPHRARRPTPPSTRCRKAPIRPVEKVLLQAPGVSQDSAASGSLHVRNDHANLQFRINGVMLPDGVTGFGSILDTGLIGSIVARHRRAAGGVRPAHGRPRSTSRRAPTCSTIRATSASTAAAAAPSSRASTMAAPSAAIAPPRPPQRRSARRRRRQRRTGASRRAIFLQRPLSADHRGHRKSTADAQRHPRFLVSRKKASPICRHSSTRGRG